MIKKPIYAFAFLALGIAAFGMSACETIERTGAIQGVAQTDIITVQKAAVKVIEDSGMNILENNVDTFAGKITSRTGDGKDLRVILERITEDSTQVHIRVGLGDKSRAQAIMNDILSAVN